MLNHPNSHQSTNEVINECKAVETLVASIVEDTLIDSLQAKKLIDAFVGDENSRIVLDLLLDGWPKEVSSQNREVKCLFCARDRLTVYRNSIMLNNAKGCIFQ